MSHGLEVVNAGGWPQIDPDYNNLALIESGTRQTSVSGEGSRRLLQKAWWPCMVFIRPHVLDRFFWGVVRSPQFAQDYIGIDQPYFVVNHGSFEGGPGSNTHAPFSYDYRVYKERPGIMSGSSHGLLVRNAGGATVFDSREYTFNWEGFLTLSGWQYCGGACPAVELSLGHPNLGQRFILLNGLWWARPGWTARLRSGNRVRYQQEVTLEYETSNHSLFAYTRHHAGYGVAI
jgi:hypothetical protein